MAKEKPPTFFPELDGEERDRADEWLHDYLRLIMRIHKEHADATAAKLSTAEPLTDSEVLASFVRPPSTNTNDEVLRIHPSVDSEAG